MRNQFAKIVKSATVLGILFLFSAQVHAQTTVYPMGGVVLSGAAKLRQVARDPSYLLSGVMRLALVNHLLFSCGPTAVTRFIASVIVNAVDLMCVRRSLPHIHEEILKLKPACTDRNAPSTVIFPVLRVGVPTPPKHCCPNAVFGCATANYSTGSMRSVPFAWLPIPLEATATARITRSKAFSQNREHPPASALTEPFCSQSRVLLISLNQTQRSEATECLS